MSTESSGSNEQILITRADRVRRDTWTPEEVRYAEQIDNTVGRAEIEKLWQLTPYERITLAVDDTIRIAKLVTGTTPYVFTTLKGLIMKSWKTTVAGIIGGLAFIVNSVFGLQLPTEAILATTVFIIGLFAKDSDVTGGTKVQ